MKTYWLICVALMLVAVPPAQCQQKQDDSGSIFANSLCRFKKFGPACRSLESLHAVFDPAVKKNDEERKLEWFKFEQTGECWGVNEGTEVLVIDQSFSQKPTVKARSLENQNIFYVLKAALSCPEAD